MFSYRHLLIGSLFVLTAASTLACKKGDDTDGAASASAQAAPPPAKTAAATATTATAAAPTAPPKATAAPSETGGGCGMDGNWKVVAYACKGEKKQPFPEFLTWTLAINGADAPFKEQLQPPMPSCTGIQPWKASCTKGPAVLTLTANGPEQCTPSGCLKAPKGKPSGGCGKVPTMPLLWSIVEQTPTSMELASQEPFSLTTCTSRGKSNPLTVWWQKQ